MRRFVIAAAIVVITLPLFAAEPNPSPRQRELIEKLLAVMNVDKKAQLKGITMSQKFPESDMWGHPYEYVVSSDRHHYRIVSAGADGVFDWDSRKIEILKEGQSPAVRYRDRLEDDFIYADGSFIQLPVQAQPKVKDKE